MKTRRSRRTGDVQDDGTSTSGDHSSTRLPYRFVVALATAGVLETAYLTWVRKQSEH